MDSRRAATPRRELAASARPLEDYDEVVERARTARFVLLGEASHGTHEFYAARAEITKRLIDEASFDAVAVEADWPDAYRVNCFVRCAGDDATPEEALRGFRRFPAWMWRNTVVRDFVKWLRARNEQAEQRAGFYGLDLYSLHTSIDAVLGYLEDADPEAAARARARYACFDRYDEAQEYGYAASSGAESCEDAVVAQLLEVQRLDGALPEDARFSAEQNARLVRNAERYYRSMFRGRASSWNLRDTHMAETLDALAEHLSRQRERPARIVVWAHNSHLGDARATQMGDWGELNLGQLVRERHGDDALLVGFSTYEGTVSAASDWGSDVERKRVRPALSGSWEDALHELGGQRLLVDTSALSAADRRLERAIGVIYRPETERASHYFEAQLAAQFDLVLHFDLTSAVEPLDPTGGWLEEEAPATFPTAV